MNDYVIGSGAVLTAGPAGSISAATLHAQTDPAIASQVTAALVDFESGNSVPLSKVLIVGTGWTKARVANEWIAPLLRRQTSTLADVIQLMAETAGAGEVHLFARWLPDEMLTAGLRRCGVTLITHPLESIRQAALISGESYTRWPSPIRAA
jgi:hypothetical protein